MWKGGLTSRTALKRIGGDSCGAFARVPSDHDRDGRRSMKIRDVMTPDIEVVTPDDTLTTATRLMADLNFEALPVEEDNSLVGMISARDASTPGLSCRTRSFISV
jgi:predicted transcriptional regulator